MSLSFTVSKRLSVDGIDYTTSCELPPNSELYYKLNIYSSNYNASTSFGKNMIFVDILPHIGDTGVLLNTTDRLSEFSISLASFELIGEILSGSTGKITQTKEFDVEYSSSYDPIRFGQNNDEVIGEDDWDNPTELDLVKSIKITTNDNLLLSSGDTLSIILKVKTPADVSIGKTAYNSYAGKIYVYDTETEETKSMLAVEGTKVGVTIVDDGSREQSFVDLIESIALQQTALSYILEGEALKIEKAMKISSQEEIILVNQSVTETIANIKSLEALFLEFIDLTCNPSCD